MRNLRAFYVVQFIELPYEAIARYVCVPGSWVLVIRERDSKAVVTYPNDEDRRAMRERVRRSKGYERTWSYYKAVIKYESDTYEDAEFWIASKYPNPFHNQHQMTHLRSFKFYAVQFIDVPFESIDDYVCVPESWVMVNRQSDRRAVVAYPNDEDPFVTRGRARRRESYNAAWRYYMAIIRYKSDTYEDAEFWIATRIDYASSVAADSTMNETQAMPISDNINQNHTPESHHRSQSRRGLTINIYRKPQVRISIKRIAQSDPREQVIEKRSKLDEATTSTSGVANVVNKILDLETGCSKRQQSNFFRHNQLMKLDHSNQRPQIEDHSEMEKQFRKNNGNSLMEIEKRSKFVPESNSAIAKFFDGISPSDPKPGCSNDIIRDNQVMDCVQMEDHSQQLSEINTNSQDLLESSENIQTERMNVETIETIDNNPRINDVSNNGRSAIDNPKFLKMPDALYRQIKSARRLVPMHKTYERTLRPINPLRKKVIVFKNPSDAFLMGS